jgi:hypothetical protein
VFTKCDALLATAFGKLTPEEKQLSHQEQLAILQEHKKEMMMKSTAWERLKVRKFSPKECVHLESKHKYPTVL